MTDVSFEPLRLGVPLGVGSTTRFVRLVGPVKA